ncbi:Alpha-tubulin N-acetyltransferase 1 [Boothiomyces sp. JEL0838]|nr:Alpha-tubulin N-acetyltransferase 1 [Boothiomyces sp. JEL0838]
MKFSFDVSDVITKPNELGAASARAQSLRGPITTLLKLKTNPDQRLYLMKEDIQDITLKSETSRDDLYMFNSAGISGFKDLVNAGKYNIVGMLKVGTKKLFVVDGNNRHIEISPLCVLDFYIDEKLQRQGYGKRLFEFMLAIEFVSPRHLAYDRPSSKFLAFLKKNYNLVDYIPQANNFVIFRQFGLEYLELDSKGRPKANIFEQEMNAFKNSRRKSESRNTKATRKDRLKEENLEKKKFSSMYFKNEMLSEKIGSLSSLAKAADVPVEPATTEIITKDEQVQIEVPVPAVEERLEFDKETTPKQIEKATLEADPVNVSPVNKENIELSVLPQKELVETDDYSDETFEEFLPQLNKTSSRINVPIDPNLDPINWESKANPTTIVANPRLLSTKPSTNQWEVERHTKLMKILNDSQPTKVALPNQINQPLTFEQQQYYVSHLKNMNSRPIQKEIYRYGKLDQNPNNISHMKN